MTTSDRWIDAAGALERLEGDEDLLHEVWRILSDDLVHLPRRLRMAFDARDVTETRRLVHGLRSAAGQAGAWRLMECCTELDIAALKGRIDDVGAGLPVLEEVVSATRETIAAMRSRHV